MARGLTSVHYGLERRSFVMRVTGVVGNSVALAFAVVSKYVASVIVESSYIDSELKKSKQRAYEKYEGWRL